MFMLTSKLCSRKEGKWRMGDNHVGTQSVTSLRLPIMLALSSLTVAPMSLAGGAIDPHYVKSLAAPGKTVLIVEYYAPDESVVDRKGFASATGFSVKSPVEITVDAKIRLHLYGLEPCAGDMINQKEGFAGSCAAYAQQQLAILVAAAKVIFCRAFVTERNAALQDATCFGYYNFPGSLDSLDNLEEQLASIGAVRLSKKADGTPMRPDLLEAEKMGRGGFGMWADPRVQKQ
jgi:hypothetical protein